MMPIRKKPPNMRSVTALDTLVGQRVRARRMELGLSQSDLADQLGLTFQQVQKYEKGSNRVGAVRLQQIAAFLKTDVDYFFGDSAVKANGPSPVTAFMATKDGVAIITAMLRLDDHHRRSVISLARTLGDAYGGEA